MNKNLSKTLLATLLGFTSATSFAVPFLPPFFFTVPETPASETSTAHTDSKVYAGLVWTWGNKQGLKPDFLLGFRSLHVESTDTVRGGDFSVRVKYSEGFKFDSARIAYAAGKRTFMGNYGAGYSFTNKAVFGTVAGQGDYNRFGADYYFKSHDFKPYVEINTLEKPDSVAPNVQPGGCPVNYPLYIGGGLCASPFI